MTDYQNHYQSVDVDYLIDLLTIIKALVIFSAFIHYVNNKNISVRRATVLYIFANVWLGTHKIFSVARSSAGQISNAPCDVPSQSFNLSSNDSHSHQNIFEYVYFVLWSAAEKMLASGRAACRGHIKWLWLWGRWESSTILIFCSQKGASLLPLITSLWILTADSDFLILFYPCPNTALKVTTVDSWGDSLTPNTPRSRKCAA